MRTIGTLFVFLGMFMSMMAQQSVNMSLLGQWDDNSLPNLGGVVYNDIWGYTVSGREFAIVGSIEKVHFYEITDPSNIVEVAAIAGGGSSRWRDMKTYGTNAYSVADESTSSEGLLVFDLASITGTGSNRVTLVDQQTDVFTRAHNVFVDEGQGILYVAGINSGDNLLVYDLNADPASPSLIADLNFAAGYIHDVYVDNNIAYCSHLGNGLHIYDMSPVTDPPEGQGPGTPVELGVLTDYPFQVFNHSSWVSGNTLVYADEKHGSPLGIVDISDLEDLEPTSHFYSNLLNVANPYSTTSPRGPIPHNPFIVGDLCIASYYHDGISIFDISNPENVVQVGYYDTDLVSTNYNGYKGCWGVYPFLPSGRIIGTDVLDGLFVLEYNTALPVEWASFTAQKEADGIRLDWSTTKEENNAGFTVQRAEGKGWVDLGQVLPEAKQTYRSYDDAPRAGWNTYRIVQEDYDGSRSYSRLATVFWGTATAGWSVYPNPARSGASLSLKNVTVTDGLWQLHNAQGQTVFRMQAELYVGEVILQLPNLFKGTYWLEEVATGAVQTLVVE
ncbi:choice-of-anchor B family protein [Lewinella cohaerens]|uniref:choice-of-anchor B family protein n=1 Tax=Lewinella cohaerens TaxID=70995 RepID=UPI00039A132A|nr:choice-of-anchor B family protein [Lewinella cohaerens]